MSVIVKLSTAPEDCPLDTLFDAALDARIVFEPLVQRTRADVQSFWVHNVPRAIVREVLDADEAIRCVRVHGDHDRDETEETGDAQSERTPVLVEVTWAEEAELSFLDLLREYEAAILAQTGTARDGSSHCDSRIVSRRLPSRTPVARPISRSRSAGSRSPIARAAQSTS